jgi:hypothetical protein
MRHDDEIMSHVCLFEGIGLGVLLVIAVWVLSAHLP